MAVLPLQCSFIDAASRTLSTTKRAANATTFPQLILTCTSYSLALRNTAAFPNYLRVETNCIDYKRSLFISKHGAEVIVRASPIAVSEGQKDEALKEVSEEIKSGAKLDSNGGGGEGGGGYKFGGGGEGGGEEEEEEEAEGGGGGGGGEKTEDKQMALSMSQKFTLCYAALVGVGGLMGYVKSGSSKSLISGGLSALVLYYVHTQLPTNTVFASSVGLGISAVLLTVMGARFRKSGKIFPAGVVSLVSLIMTGGYLHVNCAALCIGVTAGPLLIRFYFLHGGSRKWFSAWLQTAGFPILLLPLSISYTTKPHNTNTHITPKLCLACIGLGVLAAVVGYMYAWGISCLPVSTSSLLYATQLAFTAIFAYLLVSHKFSPYSINAVILLTMGPVLLAFHTGSDRPEGVTTAQYWLGFVVTICSAAISGLISPLIELVIKKTGRRILTYRTVMEMQVIMAFTATVFYTVSMVVNKDFQAIATEARASDVGEFMYYMVIVWTAICWQLSSIGAIGVIFLSSALLSGLLNAVFIPVTEVLAVFLYDENFSGDKGMAVAMALWGFASYLYGEYKASKLEVSNIDMTEDDESESLLMNIETER